MIDKKNRGRGLRIALLSAAILTLSGCRADPGKVFYSPYADLNWENIGHYDAQFHIHPGLGGEQYDPHQTVDRYIEEGYKILAFTPHDYDIPDDHIDSLYPWTEFSQIYETIKHVNNPNIKAISIAMDERDFVVLYEEVNSDLRK
jgi:hypothetical protein